jgi:hypothetical protein
MTTWQNARASVVDILHSSCASTYGRPYNSADNSVRFHKTQRVGDGVNIWGKSRGTTLPFTAMPCTVHGEQTEFVTGFGLRVSSSPVLILK